MRAKSLRDDKDGCPARALRSPRKRRCEIWIDAPSPSVLVLRLTKDGAGVRVPGSTDAVLRDGESPAVVGQEVLRSEGSFHIFTVFA